MWSNKNVDGRYSQITTVGEQKPKELFKSSLEVKKKSLKDFFTLVENQITHGGDKYKLSDTKEVTDGICEMFPGDSGVDWILGTMSKYLGRFKNEQREKDLLKIAAYAYIVWIKYGFQFRGEHDEDTKR